MSARWNFIPTRCATCQHGASTHTGGHGQCWMAVCACPKYADAVEVAEAMERHPSGKGRDK